LDPTCALFRKQMPTLNPSAAKLFILGVQPHL
jgi:hypothetical protein